MVNRRTFLRLLLAAIAAPSVVALVPPAARRISITIKSEPGMVSVDWIEKMLAPELKKISGRKARVGQKLINRYLREVKKND